MGGGNRRQDRRLRRWRRQLGAAGRGCGGQHQGGDLKGGAGGQCHHSVCRRGRRHPPADQRCDTFITLHPIEALERTT
eukprot:2335936-Pyramimonas_sp.AAC.1